VDTLKGLHQAMNQPTELPYHARTPKVQNIIETGIEAQAKLQMLDPTITTGNSNNTTRNQGASSYSLF